MFHSPKILTVNTLKSNNMYISFKKRYAKIQAKTCEGACMEHRCDSFSSTVPAPLQYPEKTTAF